MIKKLILIALSITTVVVVSLAFVACEIFDDGGDAKKYEIIYMHDGVRNIVDVKDGELYTITPPAKYGYDFIGLFDAPEGGVMFVTPDGVCCAHFSEGKNLVLYPQFRAKQVTLTLYDGDAKSIVKDFKYGDNLLDSPIDFNRFYNELEHEHSDFIGWYRLGKGTGEELIISADGTSEFTLDNNLLDNDFSLDLYAKFKMHTVLIKFYRRTGEIITEKIVDYGTEMSQVVKNIKDEGIPVEYWTNKNSVSQIDFSSIKAENDGIEYYVGKYVDEVKCTYVNNEKLEIGTQKLGNNPADTVNIESLLGCKVQRLIDAGYTKVKMKLVVKISEKDDGYQEVYLGKSRSGTVIWSKKDIEHGKGYFAKEAWDHTFEIPEIDATQINNVMYILYSAHGVGANGWNRRGITLEITFFKTEDK